MKYIDETYIRMIGSHLKLFKATSNGVYQFRCPYCGDSDKSQSKARGYFFEVDDTYLFKCFNCPMRTNLRGFLKDNHYTLYTDYKKDKLMSHGKAKPKKAKVVNTDDVKTDTSKHFKKTKTPGNLALKQAVKVREVEFAYNYLVDRNIPTNKIDTLYYVSDINKITSLLPKYKDKKFKSSDAIVIPFINRSGVVTHVQFRMFEGDFRYMTLQCIETRTKIYGLDTVDADETVYVFEGPIDSMFCNGIAVANGSLHTMIPTLDKLFKNYTLVYDKDLINNKDVYASLEKSIKKGCNVLLYDRTIINSTAKDLNDMVSDGLITDVDNYLLNNTYTGFKARMYLDSIKQIKKTKSPFSHL